MKKTSFNRFSWSCRLLLTLMVAGLLSACSNKSAEKMLQLVPDATKGVALIRLDKVEEDLDEGSSESKAQLMDQLARAAGVSQAQKADVEKILGYVEMTSAVSFEDKGKVYVVCNVDSEEDVAGILAKLSKQKVVKEGEYSLVGRHLAVGIGRLWVCSESVDPIDLQRFCSQNKEDSFLSIDYSKTMLKSDADLSYLINYDALLPEFLGVSNAMSVRMGLSMIYESPKFIAGETFLMKGKVKSSACMLNSDYKLAKTSMKFGEISSSIINDFPGRADMAIGISLGKETVKNLIRQFGAMVGTGSSELFDQFNGELLMGVDLTQFNSRKGSGWGVMIGFNDPQAAIGELRNLVSGLPGVEVKSVGKYAFVGNGLQTGSLHVDTGCFKGASFATAINFKGVHLGSDLPVDKLDNAWTSLVVKDGSLQSEGETVFSDGDLGALASILKVILQMAR